MQGTAAAEPQALPEAAEGTRFWVCWAPNAKAPRFRHATFEAAQAEAQRVSAHSNREVFILACELTVKPQPITVEVVQLT